LLGIAHRTTQVNGTTNFPQVKEMLGQLAAEASMIDAFVHAMEVKGTYYGPYYVPDKHTLYAAQTMAQQLYSKFITSMRELAGGGVIMLPSSVHDFGNPEIGRIIGKTQQSPVANAEDRVKFFKLAWDAIGSEFASRHTQYEMFYAGASFVVKNHAYRTYNWAQSDGMLNTMLDSYKLEDEVSRSYAQAAE
jgi:4-hydroxyphenylacetate 3-monooxygenase